jgi:small subunit ribosomal protein S21
MNFNVEIKLQKDEPVDRALKRLKGKLDAECIMEEARRHRAFETPNQKRKRKLKLKLKQEKIARSKR